MLKWVMSSRNVPNMQKIQFPDAHVHHFPISSWITHAGTRLCIRCIRQTKRMKLTIFRTYFQAGSLQCSRWFFFLRPQQWQGRCDPAGKMTMDMCGVEQITHQRGGLFRCFLRFGPWVYDEVRRAGIPTSRNQFLTGRETRVM